MKKHLSTIFALALCLFTLAGCASTQTYYNLNLHTSDPERIEFPCHSLRLTMGKDLRAYTDCPLIFKKDGTVVEYRSLKYYAPIDILLQQQLTRATQFAADKGELRLQLTAFRIDERDAVPFVAVAFKATLGDKSASCAAARKIDSSYTPETIAEALASACNEAYAALAPKLATK